MNLAQWTDGDIWKMYRIHGLETLQFRAEAQATGPTATGEMRYADQDRYDDLIDAVAASGEVVLELPKREETLASDIEWQVPPHYRT